MANARRFPKLYEATTFATDNKAFEIRILQRSGPSRCRVRRCRMVSQDLEIVFLGMEGGDQELQPTAWITARDLSFTKERVTIER